MLRATQCNMLLNLSEAVLPNTISLHLCLLVAQLRDLPVGGSVQKICRDHSSMNPPAKFEINTSISSDVRLANKIVQCRACARGILAAEVQISEIHYMACICKTWILKYIRVGDSYCEDSMIDDCGYMIVAFCVRHILVHHDAQQCSTI
ncbi:hypothetical protein LENED_006825 [Lentinula edodes]|uniref:Uncharacterized protein n=1 Tax=Lentinula edodes TaxID=5353 RepID=A0A1Q3ECR0_LENED|nr:hypothetical protein LENED_006825 [Lentinula edodes]